MRVRRRSTLGGGDTGARRELMGLIALLALAGGLRVAWVLYAARPPVGVSDPSSYMLFAHLISTGVGYRFVDLQQTTYFPVGYPAALGAVFWVVRNTPLPNDFPLAAGFFNAGAGVATVLLAGAVGRRLFGPAVGLTAAGIVAIFPNLVFHSAAFLSETLFAFLALAAVAVVAGADWEAGRLPWPRLAAFGAMVGLAALVRPVSLSFVPIVGVVSWAGGAGARRALVQLAIALAAAALVTAPWAIRNSVVAGEAVFISNNLGDDLCLGRNPDASGGYNQSPYCRGAAFEHLPRAKAETLRNRDNVRRAVEYALDHPGRELGLLARRAFILFRHDHDGLVTVESNGEDRFIGDRLRAWLARAADGFFFVVLVAGVIGARAFLDRRHPQRLTVLLCMVALLAVPLAFFGDPRFHVPALPLLSIIAALPLSRAIGALRARRQPRRT